MVRIGVAIERMPGGGNTVRAIAALPALAGSFRHVGGGMLQMPIWAFPLKWDTLHGVHLAQPGRRVVNQWQLGAALTGELALDPPVKALMVWNSNPAVVASGQQQILAGLARDDLFTVVHEQYLTDTARHADIVLPATTQVEQTDLMFSWGHLYWTYNPPAIEPLGEAVPNNECFRRLAGAMGVDDPWFSMSDEEQILAAVDWDAPQMAGITLDRLKAETWVRLSLPPADQYAPHAEGGFPTPTGKVEIESTMAAAVGNWVAPLFRQGSNDNQVGGSVAPLPTYIPPLELGQNPAYPLVLLSPNPHAYLNSQYGNMDTQRKVQGSQTCNLHPDDAGSRGIAAGDRVKIWNDRGEIIAVAKVTDDVRPGVVVVPMGQWPSLADGGLGVNAITPTRFADIGQAPTFSDNAVKVAKA
jgi:anaerobic selenocysteine-containing dehydrogenase